MHLIMIALHEEQTDNLSLAAGCCKLIIESVSWTWESD